MSEGENVSQEPQEQEIEVSYYKPNLKDRIGNAADRLKELGVTAKKRLEKLQYKHRIIYLDQDPRLKTYLSPENLDPNADNFNPYYPDLGPLPEIDKNRLERVETLDLGQIPDGSVVGLSSFYSYEDEKTKTIKNATAGHPDAIYTAQVIDSPNRTRYLRIWRTDIYLLCDDEYHEEAEGQGLIVKLNDFLNNIMNDKNPLIRPNHILYFPLFNEGEGPFGSIAIPKQEELLSYGIQPREIYYQSPIPSR
jgi:hypothetical protein